MVLGGLDRRVRLRRLADGGIIGQRGDGFQAASLGKMPTTSLRRLISPLRRSSRFVTGIRIAVRLGRSVLAYGATKGKLKQAG
jgi:hypothetical protein